MSETGVIEVIITLIVWAGLAVLLTIPVRNKRYARPPGTLTNGLKTWSATVQVSVELGMVFLAFCLTLLLVWALKSTGILPPTPPFTFGR